MIGVGARCLQKREVVLDVIVCRQRLCDPIWEHEIGFTQFGDDLAFSRHSAGPPELRPAIANGDPFGEACSSNLGAEALWSKINMTDS